MTLRERLQQLVAALPSDSASVTLDRADLLDLLAEGPVDVPSGSLDLTVEEVASETYRAPSTVRGWLLSGELDGYKLNRRDWRVPRSALRAYLDRQIEPTSGPTHRPKGR